LLEPGFYVLWFLNQPGAPRTRVGFDVVSNGLFGGVIGGWLDEPTGEGYSAFCIAKPETVEFLLLFGEAATGLGAGQPSLEIFYQKEDSKRIPVCS
jgi:hypothetical protein